jgi:hypothetical protein
VTEINRISIYTRWWVKNVGKDEVDKINSIKYQTKNDKDKNQKWDN